MNTQLIKSACAAFLAASLFGCGGGDEAVAPVMTVDASGFSTVNVGQLKNVVATYPIESLSAAEAASLAYMREEEQLAHDVYAVSAGLWVIPAFVNITDSEATHSAAIKVLLDRYQQPDPLAGLPNGTFKTPEFQTLYDSLVAASQVSLIEALKVGAEIEELDIRDINAQKTNIDNADILLVYTNLVNASANHLRAFMKVLTLYGGTYVPKYITQEEFDAIINAQ
ncbi:MAG: DUF2202 domain-containing protein [Polaromonas sp.]|nr:DUF2202 domain-containing protein [Polaromonas sp.]